MFIIQKMNTQLEATDFRVPRFLKLLPRTGGVTPTTELLEISQLAVSRILARICDLTGDPLLIRPQADCQLTDHASLFSNRYWTRSIRRERYLSPSISTRHAQSPLRIALHR